MRGPATGPGERVLTLTPAGPTSKARVDVSPRTAIFEAVYGVRWASGHGRQEGPAHEERAADVDVEDLVPLLHRDVGESCDRTGDAGVVDEDGDLGVGERVAQPVDRGRVGDVADDAARSRPQPVDDRVELRRVAADDDDLGTRLVQRRGDGRPQSASAAGDDRGAAAEVGHRAPVSAPMLSSIHAKEVPPCRHARASPERA
jgi:hypothetical protein